jgi:hypothetical protein
LLPQRLEVLRCELAGRARGVELEADPPRSYTQWEYFFAVGERLDGTRTAPKGAHHLVHRALVAVDGLHHPFEHRVENLACLFRVTVGEQLHRALEVGEEHRHLLALALQGALGVRIFSARCLGV